MSETRKNKEKIIQVAMIPDDTTIIINCGYDDMPIKPGKLICIYQPGPDIIDPTTKKKLGKYEYLKEQLEITEVHQFYSIARKTPLSSLRKNSSKARVSPMIPDNSRYPYAQINVNPGDNLQFQFKNDGITVGDLVKFNNT